MRYVVSVSGGAGSTLAAHRAAEKFGIDAVDLVFADTNTEDPTLYALLDHMDSVLKPVIRLSDGRNIWDVFDQSGIIRTPNGACKASLELKQKPIASWVRDNCDPETHVLVSGLDFMEPERQMRFNARWKPFRCWHPLSDNPRLSSCQIVDAVRALGYPDQALYERRYPHNNCGGACILAGLGQWHGLYLDYPERFAYHEERERKFNAARGEDVTPFTVLRDQSGDTVSPITLAEFRRRIETNDQTLNLREFRSACGCFLGDQGDLFDEAIMEAA